MKVRWPWRPAMPAMPATQHDGVPLAISRANGNHVWYEATYPARLTVYWTRPVEIRLRWRKVGVLVEFEKEEDFKRVLNEVLLYFRAKSLADMQIGQHCEHCR
jgi:hypothetical protein